MNVNFLNPFVEAANEVLMAEMNVSTTRGPLSLHKSALTTDDVTVLISLVDELQGVVLYGLSYETALKFVSLMMGQDFQEFDNLAQSGIAELGNVITGRATIKLAEAGYRTNISPPTLISGRGVQISTLDFPRLVVPLQTSLGDLVVHLAVRESPPDMKGSNFVPLAVNGAGS
ncbi:MAG: chemotaxis protein CheX [Thermanaerothrix sp.]|nr:chemotaxis protein CheX [Thermanaerothrix sp.]